MPIQVIHIDFMVTSLVAGQGENLSVNNGFNFVKLQITCFKESWLVTVFVGFAIHRITCTDEFFQPKPLEILGKKLGKVAPFWVITG